MKNIVESWKSSKNTNFSKVYFYSFFSSIISGLIAHGYIITNKISFHDDINALFTLGGTYSLGRWNLGVIGEISKFLFGGPYSTPFFNGTMSILLIAISGCIIINLLQIRSPINAILVGAILVVYPTVTATFAYMFTAPSYFLSLFFACLGVLITDKLNKKTSFLIGGGIISLSLGIYQAYFPVSISLFVVMLIIKNLEPQCNTVKLSIKYFLSALSGLVFYFILNKFFLIATKTSLSSYQGISNMTDISFDKLTSSILRSYRLFFRLPLAGYLGMNNGKIAKCAFFISIISIIIIGVIVVVKSFRISFIKGTISCGLFALLPLSTTLINVMVQSYEFTHSLMVYATVLILIIPLAFVEKIEINFNYKLKSCYNCVVMLSTLAVIFFYSYYANIAYMKIDFIQSQSISYFTRLVTRIESTDGYRADIPIAYINGNKKHISHSDLDEYNILEDLTPFYILPVNSYSWTTYVSRWCGFSPKMANKATIYELSLKPEVQNMPSYPDDGSIKIINDTLVVKF